MYRGRIAAAFLLSFFLVSGLVYAQGDPDAKEANLVCKPVTEYNKYRTDKPWNQKFKENNKEYFNNYGTPCKDMEGEDVAASGHCTSADTCFATKCAGADCKKPTLKTGDVLKSLENNDIRVSEDTPPVSTNTDCTAGSLCNPALWGEMPPIRPPSGSAADVDRNLESLLQASMDQVDADAVYQPSAQNSNWMPHTDFGPVRELPVLNPDTWDQFDADAIAPQDRTTNNTPQDQQVLSPEDYVPDPDTALNQPEEQPATEKLADADTKTEEKPCSGYGYLECFRKWAGDTWDKGIAALNPLSSAEAGTRQDERAGKALIEAAEIACKATGCDPVTFAQALGGSCTQESQCNPSMQNKGSQYQGLGQLGRTQVESAYNALIKIRDSGNLSPEEVAKVEAVLQRTQSWINHSTTRDPRFDPVDGSYLFAARQTYMQEMGGTRPLENIQNVAPGDALTQAQLIQATQLAPSIHNNGQIHDWDKPLTTSQMRAFANNGLGGARTLGEVVDRMSTVRGYSNNLSSGVQWVSALSGQGIVASDASYDGPSTGNVVVGTFDAPNPGAAVYAPAFDFLANASPAYSLGGASFFDESGFSSFDRAPSFAYSSPLDGNTWEGSSPYTDSGFASAQPNYSGIPNIAVDVTPGDLGTFGQEPVLTANGQQSLSQNTLPFVNGDWADVPWVPDYDDFALNDVGTSPINSLPLADADWVDVPWVPDYGDIALGDTSAQDVAQEPLDFGLDQDAYTEQAQQDLIKEWEARALADRLARADEEENASVRQSFGEEVAEVPSRPPITEAQRQEIIDVARAQEEDARIERVFAAGEETSGNQEQIPKEDVSAEKLKEVIDMVREQESLDEAVRIAAGEWATFGTELGAKNSDITRYQDEAMWHSLATGWEGTWAASADQNETSRAEFAFNERDTGADAQEIANQWRGSEFDLSQEARDVVMAERNRIDAEAESTQDGPLTRSLGLAEPNNAAELEKDPFATAEDLKKTEETIADAEKKSADEKAESSEEEAKKKADERACAFGDDAACERAGVKVPTEAERKMQQDVADVAEKKRNIEQAQEEKKTLEAKKAELEKKLEKLNSSANISTQTKDLRDKIKQQLDTLKVAIEKFGATEAQEEVMKGSDKNISSIAASVRTSGNTGLADRLVDQAKLVTALSSGPPSLSQAQTVARKGDALFQETASYFNSLTRNAAVAQGEYNRFNTSIQNLDQYIASNQASLQALETRIAQNALPTHNWTGYAGPYDDSSDPVSFPIASSHWTGGNTELFAEFGEVPRVPDSGIRVAQNVLDDDDAFQGTAFRDQPLERDYDWTKDIATGNEYESPPSLARLAREGYDDAPPDELGERYSEGEPLNPPASAPPVSAPPAERPVDIALSDGAVPVDTSLGESRPVRGQAEVDAFVLSKQEEGLRNMYSQRDALERQLAQFGPDYIPSTNPEVPDAKALLEQKIADMDKRILASTNAYNDYVDGKDGPVKEAAERYRIQAPEGTVSTALGVVKDTGDAWKKPLANAWDVYTSNWGALRTELGSTLTGERFEPGRIAALTGSTVLGMGNVALQSVPWVAGVVTSETAGAVQEWGNQIGAIGFEKAPEAQISLTLDPIGTQQKLASDAVTIGTLWTPGVAVESGFLRGGVRGASEVFEVSAAGIAARTADDVARGATAFDDAIRGTTLADNTAPGGVPRANTAFDDGARTLDEAIAVEQRAVRTNADSIAVNERPVANEPTPSANTPGPRTTPEPEVPAPTRGDVPERPQTSVPSVGTRDIPPGGRPASDIGPGTTVEIPPPAERTPTLWERTKSLFGFGDEVPPAPREAPRVPENSVVRVDPDGNARIVPAETTAPPARPASPTLADIADNPSPWRFGSPLDEPAQPGVRVPAGTTPDATTPTSATTRGVNVEPAPPTRSPGSVPDEPLISPLPRDTGGTPPSGTGTRPPGGSEPPTGPGSIARAPDVPPGDTTGGTRIPGTNYERLPDGSIRAIPETQRPQTGPGPDLPTTVKGWAALGTKAAIVGGIGFGGAYLADSWWQPEPSGTNPATGGPVPPATTPGSSTATNPPAPPSTVPTPPNPIPSVGPVPPPATSPSDVYTVVGGPFPAPDPNQTRFAACGEDPNSESCKQALATVAPPPRAPSSPIPPGGLPKLTIDDVRKSVGLPPAQTPPPKVPPPSAPPPSPVPPPQGSWTSRPGGGLGGALGGLSSILGQLLGKLFGQNNSNQPKQGTGVPTPTPATTTPSTRQPSVGITANPMSVRVGSTTRLSWAGVNTDTCSLSMNSANIFNDLPSRGSRTSPALATTTVFSISCTGVGTSTRADITVIAQ